MLTANEIRSIINERLKEYNYLLQNTNFKDLNITHSISNGTRKKGVVIGENSFVSGSNNEASAPHTAAIGTNNVAKGNSSMAIGEGTSAYSDFQFVHGKFNELDANDQYAHIVGGGTVDAPKNIYVLLDILHKTKPLYTEQYSNILEHKRIFVKLIIHPDHPSFRNDLIGVLHTPIPLHFSLIQFLLPISNMQNPKTSTQFPQKRIQYLAEFNRIMYTKTKTEEFIMNTIMSTLIGVLFWASVIWSMHKDLNA